MNRLKSFTNKMTPKSQRRSQSSFDHGMDEAAALKDPTLLEKFPWPIKDMELDVVTDSSKLNFDEAIEDTSGDEKELEPLEEQRHVMRHIFSQLKSGVDLTKIVSPTFILEKKSLLEMFADYMVHPQLFISIGDCMEPESRMLAVLRWYLTAFHASKKDTIAKKPYNSIIGETFHCSWKVPKDFVKFENSEEMRHDGDVEQLNSEFTTIIYDAEQISHHPPTSIVRFHCPEKQMELSGSVATKPSFQGFSICASMLGTVKLKLMSVNEEYHFSLPSAYCRSFLTTPWIELGDKLTITCPQTNFHCAIHFHTRSMYGNDKLHKVTAEMFGPNKKQVMCRATGYWNNNIEFDWISRNKGFKINVKDLKKYHKRLIPLDNQRPEESRRVWQHVSEALKSGDLDTATLHKRQLEERQRVSEKYRQDNKMPFPSRCFIQKDSEWVLR